MKTYQGHRNIKMVDSYIEQKHLSDDIKSEKHNIVQKGVYYKEVVFKDEPHMTYVIQPIEHVKVSFLKALILKLKSIKDAKHNYFNQNFKP